MERISIGFAAGQNLSLRVKKDSLDALRESLAGGKGDLWFPLDSEDGVVSLRLDSIVFLRVESSDSKVGFGSIS
jgi:hypothetical protein